MPPATRNNPPPTMTWVKATPVIGVTIFFDALRIACNLLWALAPLIIGAGTYSAVGGATGSETVAAGAGVFATWASLYGMPFFVALGTVLAMAVGLMGWLSLVFLLVLSNTRVLKEIFQNPTYFLLGLGTTQIPFLSMIPALTMTTVQLYRRQIKKEQAALASWRASQTEQTNSLTEQQLLRASQLRAAYEESIYDEGDEEIPEIGAQAA